MTDAERMRRYRAKLRASKPVTLTITQDDAAQIVHALNEVAQAKERIAQLEDALAKADEDTARYVRLAKGRGVDFQFSATLYDLLSAYAQRRNEHGLRRTQGQASDDLTKKKRPRQAR
jgi:hypothetical protein